MTPTLSETDHLNRIATMNALAEENGVQFKGQLLFPEGTELYDSGHRTYDKSRTKFLDRQLVLDAKNSAVDAYKGQQRVDVLANVWDLHMTNGMLRAPSSNTSSTDPLTGAPTSLPEESSFAMTRYAVGQLVSRAEGPTCSVAYLAECGNDLLSINVNYWLEAFYGKECERQSAAAATTGTKKAREFAPKDVMLRTLKDGDKPREVYATLSTEYQPRDLPWCVDKLTESLAELGMDTAGARGEFKMSGPRWTFKVTFHSELAVGDVRVGDIFRATWWMSGVDDGTGSVKVGVSMEKVRCRNLTTISSKEVVGLRHNSKDFVNRIKEALRLSGSKVAAFAKVWADAARDSIFSSVYDCNDPRQVFEELAKRGLVKLAGEDRTVLVDRLVKAWEDPMGGNRCYTRKAVVDSVTLAAHTCSWSNPWAGEELEKAAGELLYNYVVIAPTEQNTGGA